jgi:hypothetical protein
MTSYQRRFTAGSQASAHDAEVFQRFLYNEVRYVPRLDNRDADHLAWTVSSRAPTPVDVLIEKLSKPLIKPEESTSEATGGDLMVIDEPVQEPAYDWMSPIRAYLDNQPPSYDNAEVERLMHKARMYHLIDRVLY